MRLVRWVNPPTFAPISHSNYKTPGSRDSIDLQTVNTGSQCRAAKWRPPINTYSRRPARKSVMVYGIVNRGESASLSERLGFFANECLPPSGVNERANDRGREMGRLG